MYTHTYVHMYTCTYVHLTWMGGHRQRQEGRGDAKRWALAVRGERDDGNERTLAFAKAVRDLHYAGLVASKRGRFSAVTT